MCVDKYTNFAVAQQGERFGIDVLRHLELFSYDKEPGQKEKKKLFNVPKE